MNTIEEKENKFRQDVENQNDFGTPIDNSVINDEEQNINPNFNTDKYLNNNNPYPDDEEDEIDEENDFEEEDEDEDLESDFYDDDFNEDDLDDIDKDSENPGQF